MKQTGATSQWRLLKRLLAATACLASLLLALGAAYRVGYLAWLTCLPGADLDDLRARGNVWTAVFLIALIYRACSLSAASAGCGATWRRRRRTKASASNAATT